MISARALLFPSEWYENFGRVIIEAMAAGLPVMASDIATPAEIVGAIGPSWLVTAGDALAWARALATLVDGSIVDGAGVRARELYEDHYSLERGLESLLAVYRDVAPACAS
jgi:glycosyltransferase involved in cell wall biosynthesis